LSTGWNTSAMSSIEAWPKRLHRKRSKIFRSTSINRTVVFGLRPVAADFRSATDLQIRTPFPSCRYLGSPSTLANRCEPNHTTLMISLLDSQLPRSGLLPRYNFWLPRHSSRASDSTVDWVVNAKQQDSAISQHEPAPDKSIPSHRQATKVRESKCRCGSQSQKTS
jgi:hypothetical protein